jgi:hypothetical protein
MKFKQIGLRAGARSLAFFNAIYPLIKVRQTNREIRHDEEIRSRGPEIAALKDIGLLLDAASRTEVAGAFTDEVARIRRLEDKLAWHLTVVALLFGAATAVGGVAISQRNLIGLPLVIGAFFWLASAGFLTLEANRAIPLRAPDVLSPVERGDLDLPKDIAGQRLQALSLNPARGWQLTNALFAAQRSLVVAVIFLAAGSLTIAADKLGQHGEPSRTAPRPSVSSNPAATVPVLPQSSVTTSSVAPSVASLSSRPN